MKGVGFLGHVISGEGIDIDPTKVQSVTSGWHPPQLERSAVFLDSRDITGDSLKIFSKIAKPMTALLKKDTKFHWTEECEASFQELKKRLTTAPVLILPDIRKDFQVYCDASRLGLGGVLMQDGRVVSHDSRQL